MKYFYLTIFLFLLCTHHTNAQLWEHYYGIPGYYETCHLFAETYDGGLICGGASGLYDEVHHTRLYKLDRNGDTLWTKLLNSDFASYTISINATLDGGIIGAGAIYPEDIEGQSKPMAFKLNECGELLWCTWFETDRVLSWAQSILPIDDGSYLLTLNSYGNYDIENTFLVKLDDDGIILWKKPVIDHSVYPEAFNPYSERMIKTKNGNYLISGKVFWKDHLTGISWLRAFYALFDSQGNEKWTTPIGVKDSILGRGYGCFENENGHFICAARHYNGSKQHGLIIELDENGTIVNQRSISPEEIAGDCYSLFFRDIIPIGDTLVLSMPFLLSSTSIVPSVISLEKDVFNDSLPIKSLRTFPDHLGVLSLFKLDNNKAVVEMHYRVSSYSTQMFIAKINSMLTSDSIGIDNTIYDSLCPKPISYSEPFLGSCNIITNIGELTDPNKLVNNNNLLFSLFPNPGRDIIYLKVKSLDINSKIDVEVVSVYGQPVLQVSGASKNQISLSISGLPKGAYMVHVYLDGIFQGTKQLIKL